MCLRFYSLFAGPSHGRRYVLLWAGACICLETDFYGHNTWQAIVGTHTHTHIQMQIETVINEPWLFVHPNGCLVPRHQFRCIFTNWIFHWKNAQPTHGAQDICAFTIYTQSHKYNRTLSRCKPFYFLICVFICRLEFDPKY